MSPEEGKQHYSPVISTIQTRTLGLVASACNANSVAHFIIHLAFIESGTTQIQLTEKE
jgi:hypothetical protein